jgi:outer membrane protein assembly factor BamB
MTHQFLPDPRDSWLLVLDADDDLFLAGPTISSTGHQNLAVSRLDARSGARLWGVELVDAWRLNGLAIDGRGDVVLVANTVEYPARRIAAKLVGANGALLWRTEMSRGVHLGIALTDDGDVLAAGTTIVGDPAFETAVVLSVARLDGATGTGRWEYRSDFSVEGEALRVVVDHAGDAYVAGSLATERRDQGFAVLKLDGARGELRWARVVPGAGPDADGQAADIVLDGRGRVVAAGSLTGDGTALDFAVASLDAATGGDGTTTCRFRRSCGGPVPRVVIPRAPAGTLPRR